jgi:3-methyladenine DNA glycosylase AlkD
MTSELEAGWRSVIVQEKTADEILSELRSLSDPSGLEVLARFGDHPRQALGGISIPVLKQMARSAGRNHTLAHELWASGIYEARLIAAMIDDPAMVTEDQMESWVGDFSLLHSNCLNAVVGPDRPV